MLWGPWSETVATTETASQWFQWSEWSEGVNYVPSRAVIRNPYADVDFDTWGRYKANLHGHTTESDGNRTPDAVIDLYVEKEYDILSLTDHDGMTTNNSSTWPWTDWHEETPEELGMIAIEGNELSSIRHTIHYSIIENSVLWDDSNQYDSYGADYEWIFGEIDSRAGEGPTHTDMMVLAHPGRYSQNAAYYLGRFSDHHSMVGMEVYNQGDRYPGDRALWDQVLQAMTAQNLELPIWAFSNDDNHMLAHTGRNYNVFFMEDDTKESWSNSMYSGAFYAVYDPNGASNSRHKDPGDPEFFSAAPVINRVVVTDTYIEIQAEQFHDIDWISSDGVVVTGVDYNRLYLTDALNGYVWARLHGANSSVTIVQPFLLEEVSGTPIQKDYNTTLIVATDILKDYNTELTVITAEGTFIQKDYNTELTVHDAETPPPTGRPFRVYRRIS